MDLEENIKISADVYESKHLQTDYTSKDISVSFHDGAKSQAAKEYWYNEFKAEQVNSMLADIGTSNYP